MSNKNFDFLRRIEELPSRLYIILAVAALVTHVAICTYSDASAAITGLVILAVYGIASLGIFLFSRHQMKLYRIESDASDQQSNSVVYAFRNSLHIPYAIVTETGKIVTVNNAMRGAAGMWDTVFNTDISSLCGCPMEEILQKSAPETEASQEEETDSEDAPAQSISKSCIVTIGACQFRIECHPLRSKGKLFYILVFHDVTQLLYITQQHHDQHTAVGYIALDNLNEIAQYVQVSYQAETRQVESILTAWAEQMGGILREYEKNKYVILFSRQMLSSCIKNKFDILDTIREVTIGEDNTPITISMGVAVTGETLAQRERDALVALDMALQRGGDQVVLKNETGNYFFGGRVKSQQKRLGGHSRIIAGRLCSMISAASNVIVMGHSNPDFDSIGACIGVAALCQHLGVDVKIVTDTECDNFHACTSRLVELSSYKNMFIDGVEGLAQSAFGTLLIIVDANNFAILEAPEIADHSFKTVVIDHHIKKQEFANEPQLSYIDPSASSASELVSEILEQTLPAGTLRKEEANILMAGIMVDTKNFTRTVGTRTFAAALYLRGAGASPEYARTFFEEPFEDYRAEAQFGSEARIYRDQIAITSIEGGVSGNSRIAAAKAADRLLTVRQVNAAFALIRMGNMVHISARSNGTINVQLILEKIGGGGHFDMAGAAIPESELQEAEQQLIGAIDAYFEDISSSGKE